MMKSRVSALLDGEIEPDEIESTLRAFSSMEQRAAWSSFSLVGAALRGEDNLHFDVSARVMAALESELTVLAPRPMPVPARSPRSNWLRSATAMAAAVAGIVVVAWVGFGVSNLSTDDAAALASATGVNAVAPLAKTQPLPPKVQDYLVAHQAHASGGALAGGSRHVVAVSLVREGR